MRLTVETSVEFLELSFSLLVMTLTYRKLYKKLAVKNTLKKPPPTLVWVYQGSIRPGCVETL